MEGTLAQEGIIFRLPREQPRWGGRQGQSRELGCRRQNAAKVEGEAAGGWQLERGGGWEGGMLCNGSTWESGDWPGSVGTGLVTTRPGGNLRLRAASDEMIRPGMKCRVTSVES